LCRSGFVVGRVDNLAHQKPSTDSRLSMHDKLPERITVRETALTLGVSPQLVYRLFHAGKLLGLKVEGAVRINRASLDEYIAAHSNAPPQVLVPGAAEAPPPSGPATPPPAPRRRRVARRETGYRFVPRE
jgi:excisionase family DNA binding protein